MALDDPQPPGSPRRTSSTGKRQSQPSPEPSQNPTRTGGGGSSSGSKLPGVPIGYGDETRAYTRADQPNWQYPYVVQRPMVPGLGASPGTVPRSDRLLYKEGDELRPIGMGAAGIAETKRKLVLAGYLSLNNIGALGIWNDDAIKAYKTALLDANRMGMSINTLLHEAALQNPGMGGGGGGGSDGGGGGGGGWTIDENGNLVPQAPEQFVPEPFTPSLPNPDDVRAVFRSASIDKLGQAMSTKDVEDMTRAYMWKVGMLQADAYQQMVARDEQLFNTGTTDIDQITTVQAPSAENWLSEELERTRPGEVNAAQVGEDYAPAFFQALGGFG